jgi:hypothetical protein
MYSFRFLFLWTLVAGSFCSASSISTFSGAADSSGSDAACDIEIELEVLVQECANFTSGRLPAEEVERALNIFPSQISVVSPFFYAISLPRLALALYKYDQSLAYILLQKVKRSLDIGFVIYDVHFLYKHLTPGQQEYLVWVIFMLGSASCTHGRQLALQLLSSLRSLTIVPARWHNFGGLIGWRIISFIDYAIMDLRGLQVAECSCLV